MNQKKYLLAVCWLWPIFCFGEESLWLPMNSINVACDESQKSPDVLLEEMFANSQTVTIETGSKSSTLIEIVYPLEESNFEEVYGSKP